LSGHGAPPQGVVAPHRPGRSRGGPSDLSASYPGLLVSDKPGQPTATWTPFFLQEWGKYCWDCANDSPVDVTDVESATATAELDASFFRVRYDRLTPKEKLYLRATAELGPGPHRSGQVAEVLDRPVQSAAPVRANLIAKGYGLQPRPRRHGVHRSHVRRVSPADDAGHGGVKPPGRSPGSTLPRLPPTALVRAFACGVGRSTCSPAAGSRRWRSGSPDSSRQWSPWP